MLRAGYVLTLSAELDAASSRAAPQNCSMNVCPSVLRADEVSQGADTTPVAFVSAPGHFDR